MEAHAHVGRVAAVRPGAPAPDHDSPTLDADAVEREVEGAGSPATGLGAATPVARPIPVAERSSTAASIEPAAEPSCSRALPVIVDPRRLAEPDPGASIDEMFSSG